MSEEFNEEKAKELEEKTKVQFELVKYLGEYCFDHTMMLNPEDAQPLLKAFQEIFMGFCESCGGAMCDSEYCPVGMYLRNIRQALDGTFQGFKAKLQEEPKQEEPKDGEDV